MEEGGRGRRKKERKRKGGKKKERKPSLTKVHFCFEKGSAKIGFTNGRAKKTYIYFFHRALLSEGEKKGFKGSID